MWDELSPEQSSVLLIAAEEGFLNEVIGNYGASIRHAETGSRMHGSALSREEELALVPRFATVVLDMVDRDLVEIFEGPGQDINGWPRVDRVETETVLADHHAWLFCVEAPETNRMILLGTTDHADRLLG